MKVALIVRSSMETVTGGDSIQVRKTAEALQGLGVATNVFLASDSIPYRDFDLLHFFNIIRPADQLMHIKRSGKPYLLSTIYLDYSSFDRNGRGRMLRQVFSITGKYHSEYIKNLYRFLSGQDKLVSKSYLAGHKRSMLKVLAGASVILPNSLSEYIRLAKDTGRDYPYHIVPNGIDKDIFGNNQPMEKREEKVISVGQIYGMKNQHRLILACNELQYPLEIIGKHPPNHSGYYKYCKSIAGRHVKFIDFMPQQDLVRHYQSARVHALPSWFETTGLTSLEAGASGCNLVVGEGGDTRDYFRDKAWYCNARDQESIVKALKEAMESENNTGIRDLILKEYTWDRAAEETLKAYNKVLHGS